MHQMCERLFEFIHPNLLRTERMFRAIVCRGSSDLDDCLANQEFAVQLARSLRLDLDA